MTRWIAVSILVILWLLPGCNTDEPGNPTTVINAKAPEEHTNGEAAFNRYCAMCHGKGATGTDHGPSFLSRIYAPDHHGDSAFLLAPRIGVRAHHWSFGDMPKIQAVSEAELKEIVGYIRWLQREAGIK